MCVCTFGKGYAGFYSASVLCMFSMTGYVTIHLCEDKKRTKACIALSLSPCYLIYKTANKYRSAWQHLYKPLYFSSPRGKGNDKHFIWQRCLWCGCVRVFVLVCLHVTEVSHNTISQCFKPINNNQTYSDMVRTVRSSELTLGLNFRITSNSQLRLITIITGLLSKD